MEGVCPLHGITVMSVTAVMMGKEERSHTGSAGAVGGKGMWGNGRVGQALGLLPRCPSFAMRMDTAEPFQYAAWGWTQGGRDHLRSLENCNIDRRALEPGALRLTCDTNQCIRILSVCGIGWTKGGRGHQGTLGIKACRCGSAGGSMPTPRHHSDEWE